MRVWDATGTASAPFDADFPISGIKATGDIVGDDRGIRVAVERTEQHASRARIDHCVFAGSILGSDEHETKSTLSHTDP